MLEFTLSNMPPSNKLRSLYRNEAPTEIDFADVLKSTEEAAAIVEHCDGLIEVLQNELSLLARQRDEAAQERDFGRAIFAPIRKLPAEILQEIFRFTDSAQVIVRPNHASRPSTTLGCVCSQWRTIVTEDSTLWTTVDIDMDGLNRLPNHWIEESLQVSKDALLSVTILSSSHSVDFFRQDQFDILLPLLACTARYKEYITFPAFLPHSFPFFYREMQRLQRLSIVSIGRLGLSTLGSLPVVSVTLPKVTEFSISYPMGALKPRFNHIPDIRRFQDVIDAALQEVQLPALKSLTINAKNYDDIQASRPLLELSQVDELTRVPGSTAGLTTLILGYLSLDVADVLTPFSQLRRLELIHCYSSVTPKRQCCWDVDLCKSLVLVNSTSRVPQLQDLRIFSNAKASFPWKALCDMIASRVAIPGEENLFQLHVETYENVLPSDIRQAFSAMSKENPRFNHTIADLGTWLKEHGSPFQCEFSYHA